MTILPLVLLGAMALLLSCAPAQTGPRAWIDWPQNGFETRAGTTLTVIAHAYAEDGVGEVQLGVDRQPYRVVTPDQAGEQFVEISADWLADEPGTYLLSVTAFDVNGQASNPASVAVRVTGEGPGLTPIPSPLTTALTMTLESPTVAPPTGTPEELPLATATSPAPPTGTPVPPTATPLPPRIVSFEVSRSQITAGECVRFSWRVDGSPTAIYFDGEGVTSPDSREKCPAATKEFELRAEGTGGGDTARLTVVVVQPSPTPDTQGPPAPGGLSPTGGAEVGCGDVTLSWNPVSDPSGVVTYYVKVEKTTGTPKSGGWTSTGTKLTIPASWLECGQGYRWAVRAEDGAGNIGPWSGWGPFVVELT
jgi:hypothetical protein